MGLGQGITQTVTLIVSVPVYIALGGSTLTGFQYVTEIAPTQVRGSLVALYGVFLGLGQLTASVALQVVVIVGPPVRDVVYF